MRREEEGIASFARRPGEDIAGLREYSRLGSGYPLHVVYGDRVRITEVRFEWMGPATTLYWCFGLKNDRAHFENGLGLEGGVDKFAYGVINAPSSSSSWTLVNPKTLQITLLIQSPMRVGITYSTWAWLSFAPSVNESDAVPVEGGDNFIIHDGTVHISQTAARVLDCNYVKV